VKDCVELNGKLHDLADLVLGTQSLVPLEWGAWWVPECLDISEKRKNSCYCWGTNLRLCNP
jgi:hypothetical protein